MQWKLDRLIHTLKDQIDWLYQDNLNSKHPFCKYSL